jgi:hypothetical protein
MTDRELDALVAEKVMGWRRFDTFLDQAHTRPVTKWVRPDRQHPSDCPKFGADIAAAWQAVEQMKVAGYEFTIEYFQQAQTWWAYFYRLPNPTDQAGHEAGTAPHAIRLAALKTLGVSV